MAQRYKDPQSRGWMAQGKCPECGLQADEHSGSAQFWLRGGDCSLLPHGVTERIQQYREDELLYVENATGGNAS